LAKETADRQAIEIKDQIDIARIASSAAKQSADVAVAIEFPIIGTNYIGPELEETGGLVRPNMPYASGPNDQWPTRYSVVSSIQFRNYGRTPAFVTRVEVSHAVDLILQERATYRTSIPCPPGTVIKERESETIEIHYGFELSEDEILRIKKTTAILWFYISLIYTDVMNREHFARFCWKWGRQNSAADEIFYFFDDGSAPPAYTRKT
jgi:hypothetical protein